MALVALRSPLRELAGGNTELDVEGETLREILGRLQQSYPKLEGWVVDERGAVRPHVVLFVNGEKASLETSVGPRDKVHVLPAISGGAVQTQERPATQMVGSDQDETELLVGTRKGLFVLRGPRGGAMSEVTRQFSGNSVEFAMRDPRSGRYLASVTHGQLSGIGPSFPGRRLSTLNTP